MAHAILRLPAVQAITGKSRTTIYNDIEKGTFPRQVLIGDRAVGWLQADVERWLDHRVRVSLTGSLSQTSRNTSHKSKSASAFAEA